VKSRSDIWLAMLVDTGMACSVSTSHDRETVMRRVKAEGDSFYTITLPTFEKDLLRSVEEGRIPSDLFRSFSRRKVRKKNETVRGVPEFFGGFLDLLFTSETGVDVDGGRLLPEPILRRDDINVSALALKSIRQLCLLFSKEKALCSAEKIDQAIQSYVDVDKALDNPLEGDIEFLVSRIRFLQRVLSIMYADVISAVEREIDHFELVPAHGPGATADAVRGNSKWRFLTWNDRLEEYFPYGMYCLPNASYEAEGQVEYLPLDAEIPAKLVSVPKTQSTPRLIAEEPANMQYIQQSLMRSLVPKLELSRFGSFVGFTDQTPNQELACIGSRDGSLATLDLSEASDRVPYWLVAAVFGRFPTFVGAISSARSKTVQLPSGEIISLRKFASMGSALTFPLETMLFSMISVASCLGWSSASRSAISRLAGSVRVYGDDIIVPTDKAASVIEGLESFGFKVNRNKSFWTGPFRESCGREFLFGLPTSVVKCREKLPESQNCVKEIVSLVSFRNLLAQEGYSTTIDILDKEITYLLRGRFPFVEETSPVLGRVPGRYPMVIDHHRDHPYLHRPEVRGYVINARSPKSVLDDVPALLKCLVTPGISQLQPDHLERSGRPRAVGLKLAWAPVC